MRRFDWSRRNTLAEAAYTIYTRIQFIQFIQFMQFTRLHHGAVIRRCVATAGGTAVEVGGAGSGAGGGGGADAKGPVALAAVEAEKCPEECRSVEAKPTDPGVAVRPDGQPVVQPRNSRIGWQAGGSSLQPEDPEQEVVQEREAVRTQKTR